MTGYTDEYVKKLERGEELTPDELAAHEAQLAHRAAAEDRLMRKLGMIRDQRVKRGGMS